MGENLNKNPIVIDLTDATSRSIRTTDVKVTSILVTGLTHAANDAFLTIREASATGRIMFQYRNAGAGATVEIDPFTIDAVLRDPFFVNDDTGAWQSGFMFINLE